MTDPKGFLKYQRQNTEHRPVEERVMDFQEMNLPLSPDEINQQAARCMDCGIPFCHGSGCPVKNRMPEFNELVYHGRWRQATVHCIELSVADAELVLSDRLFEVINQSRRGCPLGEKQLTQEQALHVPHTS